MTEITEIWLENRRAGTTIGIDEDAPRISFTATEPSDTYELEFTRDRGTVERASVAESSLIAWPFAPLAPREGGALRVRGGATDAWTAGTTIERGLADDWRVDFASPSTSAPHGPLRPAFLLRASFELRLPPERIAKARLYSTAHGVYELEVNGGRLGDDVLAPGWTSYSHRLRYQTHDLGASLHAGENVLGAWLADGWYRGRIGFDGGLWDIYGADVALLAQLELTTVDGEHIVVPLDWTFVESPITAVGLYEGETFDARRLPDGWSAPGFDASGWAPAIPLPRESFAAAIEAPTALPVQETEVLRPVSVDRRPERTHPARLRPEHLRVSCGSGPARSAGTRSCCTTPR